MLNIYSYTGKKGKKGKGKKGKGKKGKKSAKQGPVLPDPIGPLSGAKVKEIMGFFKVLGRLIQYTVGTI